MDNREGESTNDGPPPSKQPGATRTSDSLEKWRASGATESNLVSASDDYVVFLRDNLDTDWETDDSFDKTFDFGNPDWGFITRNVSRLEAVPIDHLSDVLRRGFRFQLGTVLALGLDKDFANAKELLHCAEDFVTARNNEVARRWFLESTGTVVILVILFPSLWGYYGRLMEQQGLTLFEKVAFCGAAGAVGSFFSVISRVSKSPLNPAAGRYIHYLEGTCRIIAGIIAGPFLLFAIKLGIILPALDKAGIEAVALVGLLAGASERIIPSLIGKTESQVSETADQR